MTVPRWLPPLGWAALILVGTSIPQSHLPDVRNADKLAHLGMYAVLGALTSRAAALDRGTRRLFWTVTLGIALFAAADEWHQGFIPGRSPDPHDWLADTVGGGIGSLAALAALVRREREPT